MDKIAIKEIQGLEQASPLVIMYEIELNADGSSRVYFTRGLDDDNTAVQFYDYDTNTQLNTYTALPVQVEGFDLSSTGPAPRPVLTIANILTTFGDALGNLNPEDLLGKKVHRRRTLEKYLYGKPSDMGAGNTPIEFPRQTYIIDRIESENALTISFELTSPFDVEGLVLPYRVVGHNACPWQFQGASPEKTEANKRGACNWHTAGKLMVGTTTYNVYVNEDDEYIVPSSTSFTAWSGSGSVDGYYSTTTTLGTASGVRRYNADGTVDTSADGSTITNYWQATRATSTTPSDTSADWNRIRVYTTYSASDNYYAYTEDRANSYALSSAGQVWKTLKTQSTGANTAPGFNGFWERGDTCGKRLQSCKNRYGFNPISGGTTGKATPLNQSLPFGGFPGARKFK